MVQGQYGFKSYVIVFSQKVINIIENNILYQTVCTTNKENKNTEKRQYVPNYIVFFQEF